MWFDDTLHQLRLLNTETYIVAWCVGCGHTDLIDAWDQVYPWWQYHIEMQRRIAAGTERKKDT